MTGALGVYPQVTGRLKENAATCTDRPYQAGRSRHWIKCGSRRFQQLTETKARALQEAARAHKVELSIYRITRAEEIEATIDKLQVSGVTASSLRDALNLSPISRMTRG